LPTLHLQAINSATVQKQKNIAMELQKAIPEQDFTDTITNKN
jgi:hypothetical protein